MKRFSITLMMLLGSSIALAGSLTIQDLPDAAEEINPVCHDGNGMLANCVHGAGTDLIHWTPVLKDAEGNILGTYAGRSLLTGADIGGDISGEDFLYALEVVTDKGYRFWVHQNGWPPQAFAGINFTEPMCQGDSYVRPTLSIEYPIGAVWFVSSLQEKWYFPMNPNWGVINVESFIDADGLCVDSSTTLGPGQAILPNDPAVTGVPNNVGIPGNPYPTPINVVRH